MEQELLRRAEDLNRRCARKWLITNTGFLSPAEQVLLENSIHPEPDTRMVFFGGFDGCERSAAFFLPADEDESSLTERICAVKYRAFFGEPGHRDYLGALLGSGISRDRLGDILISNDETVVFCLPGIYTHLLGIDRIGRVSVKAEGIPLDQVKPPERETKKICFSVMSLRLDAVAAGMFRLSRTACAKLINEKAVSLQYAVCMKPDAVVEEGDIISVRGRGKGIISEIGGTSRRGRIFVTAEIYL
jgi:RNA-binding protein YlmH